MSKTELRVVKKDWLPGRFEYHRVKNGDHDAEYVGYHDNGIVGFIYPVVGKDLQGTGRTWHRNGSLQCEEHYVKGRLHGVRKEWHPDGKVLSESHYVYGQMHGPLTEWYETGALKSRRLYDKGRLEGAACGWHPNGRLKYRASYIAGVRNGISKGWDNKGKPVYTRIFVRGVMVSMKTAGLLHSGKLTARDILRTSNAAVRRICLEEFGYGRFLSQLHHKVIDRDGETELVRIDWRKDELPLYLVKVKCATTGAFYTLRVPPAKKAKEAVAWTFGLGPKEYRPEKET